MLRMFWLFLMEVCVSYCLNFRQSGHGHGSLMVMENLALTVFMVLMPSFAFCLASSILLYGKLFNFSLILSRNSNFPALVANSELELFIVKMS